MVPSFKVATDEDTLSRGIISNANSTTSAFTSSNATLNLNTSTENDPAVPLDFGGDILTSGILLSGFHSNSTSLSDLVSHNIDITGGTAQQASDEKYESSAAQSSSAQSSSATAQLIEEKYEIPGKIRRKNLPKLKKKKSLPKLKRFIEWSKTPCIDLTTSCLGCNKEYTCSPPNFCDECIFVLQGLLDSISRQ